MLKGYLITMKSGTTAANANTVSAYLAGNGATHLWNTSTTIRCVLDSTNEATIFPSDNVPTDLQPFVASVTCSPMWGSQAKPSGKPTPTIPTPPPIVSPLG